MRAAAVLFGFILSVKRTDTTTARSWTVAPAAGRKRTTDGATAALGAATVRTAMDGSEVKAIPSPSTRPLRETR